MLPALIRINNEPHVEGVAWGKNSQNQRRAWPSTFRGLTCRMAMLKGFVFLTFSQNSMVSVSFSRCFSSRRVWIVRFCAACHHHPHRRCLGALMIPGPLWRCLWVRSRALMTSPSSALRHLTSFTREQVRHCLAAMVSRCPPTSCARGRLPVTGACDLRKVSQPYSCGAGWPLFRSQDPGLVPRMGKT